MRLPAVVVRSRDQHASFLDDASVDSANLTKESKARVEEEDTQDLILHDLPRRGAADVSGILLAGPRSARSPLERQPDSA